MNPQVMLVAIVLGMAASFAVLFPAFLLYTFLLRTRLDVRAPLVDDPQIAQMTQKRQDVEMPDSRVQIPQLPRAKILLLEQGGWGAGLLTRSSAPGPWF